MASIFLRIVKRGIAGLIGCGAGLNPVIEPEEIKPAFHFGLAGLADFNHGEIKLLDAAFDGAYVAAETGHANKALRHLNSAVDTGFSDIQVLETVKAFDVIRATPEYREIQGRIN